MRKALIEAILKMSEEEAVGLWSVCSMSAENQREYMESAEEDDTGTDSDRAELRAAEAIENAGNTFMMRLAG